MAKPIDIELIFKLQKKDMSMIFLMIPHKKGGLNSMVTALCQNKAFFTILLEKCRNAKALKIIS